MQSGAPVVLAVASSPQRRSPPGSRKLKFKKMPVPRSRQLALVRAHQLLLCLPSRPSTTNPWACMKTPNRKSQMAALRLQIRFNRSLSPQSMAPAPVLVRRAMAGRPTKGLRLEKSILRIRPTRTSGWDRLQHMGTNKSAVRIGNRTCLLGPQNKKSRRRGGRAVYDRRCWVSVWSAGCALCCSPRFAYVFAFLFLAVDGVLDPP